MERRMILLFIDSFNKSSYCDYLSVVEYDYAKGEKSKYLDEGICHVYLSGCWSFHFFLCLSFI